MNTNTKARFAKLLEDTFGAAEFSRKQAIDIGTKNNLLKEAYHFVNSKEHNFKVSRGVFSFATLERNKFPINKNRNVATPVDSTADAVESPLASPSVVHNFAAETLHTNLVPEVDKLFVKFGEFDLVSKIISSRMFYPMFITGLSGNGKTFGVEQACAHHDRELYRVNITIETDEDDLLGGFRLVNDSTKWFDGPVVRAMKSGGVLLLDEVDLGSNKLLCLQPVLEGKGILLKKINQFVKPAPGFTIVATANTKGQGSETGKFVGTNILNEAFLERFCATFEQKYPEEKVEKNILKKLCASHDLQGDVMEDFIQKLVTWAIGTRKTFETGGTSDLISTRRLVHIVNAYAILGHPSEDDKKALGDTRRQAIELCIARFDESTKASFLSFYETLDPLLNPESDKPQTDQNEESLEAKEHDIISILTNKS
jgi:AAA domain (dynein-related subfamily)